MKTPCYLTALIFIGLMLGGCSGVVSLRRTLITPMSASGTVQEGASTIDAFLTSRGYKTIPMQYLALSVRGDSYRPIAAFGKHRGGEFRVFESNSALLLQSWYGYIPPFGFDSPQFHEEDRKLLDILTESQVFTLNDVTYER